MKTAQTQAALAAAWLSTGACIVLPPAIREQIATEDGAVGTGGTGGDEGVGGSAPTSALPPCNAGASDGCAAVEALTLGSWHSCALVDDGHVWCWGSNLHGQLGNPEVGHVSHLPPQRVAGLDGVSAIEATQDTTCAVVGGDVYCWGKNELGQLGLGVRGEVSGLHRVLLPAGSIVRELSGTSDTFCAIAEVEDRHTVYCWGRLLNGQPWYGVNGVATPQAIGGFSDAPRLGAIATGTYTACVATEDGMEVRCWGGNSDVSIGNGEYGNSMVAKTVSSTLTTPVTSISNRSFPCTTADGTVQCWGNLQAYEPAANVAVPTIILGLDGHALTQSQGWKHQCFHRDGGVVDCRGYNNYFELGAPVSPGLNPGSRVYYEGVVHLAVGWQHNCVIVDDGGVECWGNNLRGQCTTDTDDYARSPKRVTFPH